MPELASTEEHPFDPAAGLPVPGDPPSYLEPFVTEAQQSARFEALWRSDNASRAYAVACLALAPLETITEEQRRASYERVASRRRRAVLSSLAGIDLPQCVLRIVARCAYHDFSADDWRAVLRLVASDARSPLCHARCISPRLVRQLASIPRAMRTPELLAVVDRHYVLPEERWRKLSLALDRAGRCRSAALRRAAAGVRSLAQLHDLLRAADDAAREATPFPEAPDLGAGLRRLVDARAMRLEGEAMRNCLANLVDDAASGKRAYYAWLGSERATLGLRRLGGGWRVARMAGSGNAALSNETERAIRAQVACALGASVAGAAGAEENAPDATELTWEDGLNMVAALGALGYPDEVREQVAGAVRSIRGRSLPGGRGAFSILEVRPFYVQCLSHVHAPTYTVEVASHHSVPEVEPHIDDQVVAVLETAGFRWPRKGENFRRSVPVHDEGDCVQLADLLLGLLNAICGSSGPVAIKTHIP